MIGKVINGYKVESFIGAGQFGEVYKASKDGKIYAIKFIRKNFIYPDYQDKRFEREVSALKRVKGKYTVEIYEDGEHTEGQTPYRAIVMELVEGKTLREIRNGDSSPWDIDKALSIIVEILQGLKTIHDAGVIHRDLKPENIKLTGDGGIKILDYGLARIIDYSSITQTGQPLGTFFYMSPEQAKGEKPIRPGSDYYSVGVMLYELLTGQILFYPSTDAQIIHKTINVKPPYPSSINPSIPNYIENVILKLLNKEVFQRFSSIDDIVKALTQKPDESITGAADRVEFYPRVIPNDTTILEDYLGHESLDGVDFPTNLHFLYKRLHSLLRRNTDVMKFFADPSTNRLAFTNFRKTKGLRELSYAPQGYDALTPDIFEEENYLKEFVSKVIEFQVGNGCNILTAPFFFFNNTSDEWFPINLKLLRESIDYVRTKYPQYQLSGAVCTQAEILCRPKERKTIIEDYGHCKTDYLQFFVDKISETTNDAQLYNFILTAKSIKDFSGTKIIACRVPTVALGLLTVGFDAITSGLGVIDNFTKSIIIKDDEGRMPTRHYFPELLSCIIISPKSRAYQDILAQEEEIKREFPDMNISLSCDCKGCIHDSLTDFQRPRRHFLHAIKQDVQAINNLGSAERRKYFTDRINRAYLLQQKLIERGVKLNSPGYLQTWKEILLKF
ncbi:MAG: serine/threonine-protein kinase [Patescibacteria group bacterium]|jgi:serine/threonine-protein kinase